MGFYSLKHGIIPACDVKTLDDLGNLVDKTSSVDGVVGFKIGKLLALKYGLPNVVETIERLTDLPAIYDDQKEGNDVEFTEPEFVDLYADSGVKALILFPFSSPRVQKACVDQCNKRKITPIGGFRLTQKLTLDNQEGTIADVGVKPGEPLDQRFVNEKFRGYLSADSPERAFRLYAKQGVNDYILPGTAPDAIRALKATLLEEGMRGPTFSMPGIGSDFQGGDIDSAIDAAGDSPSYPIIGRAIFKAQDITAAAKKFSEITKKHGW